MDQDRSDTLSLDSNLKDASLESKCRQVVEFKNEYEKTLVDLKTVKLEKRQLEKIKNRLEKEIKNGVMALTEYQNCLAEQIDQLITFTKNHLK